MCPSKRSVIVAIVSDRKCFRSETSSGFAENGTLSSGPLQSLIGPSSPQTYSGSTCVLSGMIRDWPTCRCPFDLERSAVSPGRPCCEDASAGVAKLSTSDARLEQGARSTMAVQVQLSQDNFSSLLGVRQRLAECDS